MKRLASLKAWLVDPWPIFAVAAVPIGYGLVCVGLKHAWLIGARYGVRSLVVEGDRAVLGGLGYVALGLFVHSFKFYGGGADEGQGTRVLRLAYRALLAVAVASLMVMARRG